MLSNTGPYRKPSALGPQSSNTFARTCDIAIPNGSRPFAPWWVYDQWARQVVEAPCLYRWPRPLVHRPTRGRTAATHLESLIRPPVPPVHGGSLEIIWRLSLSPDVRHKAASPGPHRSPPALGGGWSCAPPVWRTGRPYSHPTRTNSAQGWGGGTLLPRPPLALGALARPFATAGSDSLRSKGRVQWGVA